MRAPSTSLLALRICPSYSTRLVPSIRGHLIRNAVHDGCCISPLPLDALLSVFLYRRLDFSDGALDFVIGEIALRSTPFRERHGLVDLGRKLAHTERVG